MDNVEERVAYLEGRAEEQMLAVNGLREAMASLEARMDRRFELLEQRLDQRFAGIDQRFAQVDQRLGKMNLLLTSLLIAIIGGMSGIIAAILQR